MSRRSSAWPALAGLLVWTFAPAALAQSERDRAAVLHERAVEALRAGRFVEAEQLEREVLAIFPGAEAAFNLGVALRGQGRAREAADLFARLHAGEWGELPPAARAEVQGLEAGARAEIGELRITASAGEPIEIRVDGERVALIAPPGGSTTVQADPGAHVVQSRASGHRTMERSVTLAPGGREELAFALAPSSENGRLIVESEPDVLIAVEGVGTELGRVDRRVAPGEYRVRVSREGDEQTSVVTVPAGRTVRVELEPPASTSLSWLWLTLGGAALAGAGVALAFWLVAESQPVGDPSGVFPITTTLGP